MRKLHGGLAAAILLAVMAIAATSAQHPSPTSSGMFEQNGRAFVGMVLQNDTLVVDLSRANISAPATLKQLIAGWDAKMGTALSRWRRRHRRSHRRSRCP
jgi:hypothetical protein